MPREYDDDRVVVIDRDRAGGLGMLLLGLAVGAGVALLYAPASGSETRHRLARGARRASRRARELAEDMGDEVTEKLGQARRRAYEMADDLADEVGDRVERARDAVGTRARAVREAVDTGRQAAGRARADLERNLADARTAYAERRRGAEEVAGEVVEGT
ncbi:MAG: YtxH domain-containing protein [Gemmatimonadetes bacterium]|nr:YtxH domain-containing protein [Gemmatimonadota bacterium]